MIATIESKFFVRQKSFIFHNAIYEICILWIILPTGESRLVHVEIMYLKRVLIRIKKNAIIKKMPWHTIFIVQS